VADVRRRRAPVGYDPGAIGVPGWDYPTAPGFVVVALHPWRVRTQSYPAPGAPEVLSWRAAAAVAQPA